jgi:hypothetical protein
VCEECWNLKRWRRKRVFQTTQSSAALTPGIVANQCDREFMEKNEN